MNTGSSTQNNSGKSLNNKTSNANKGTNSNSRHHGGNNGGSGKPGSGGVAGGRGPDDRNKHDSRTNKNSDHKQGPKGPAKNHSSGAAGSKAGKDGASGKQGSPGKEGKPGHDAKAGNNSTTSNGHSGNGERTTLAKALKDDTHQAAERRLNQRRDADPPKPAVWKADDQNTSRKVDLEKKPRSQDPMKPGKTDGTAPHAPTDKSAADGKKKPAADTSKKTVTPAPATPTTSAGTGRPLNVQESREAGYRDGVRAGTVAAHLGAYRDGVRDGWADRKQDAAREKGRLDKAHADHKQQPQPQPTTLKVPPMPTHAPTNTAPQPVQVTGIDATHIQLGTGASRTHISRGEVRTLAGFQRKLAEKTDALTQISERTRALEAHAKVQADRITNLLEQARAVKGGEKLAAALTRLQEAAKVQEGHAAEVRKRAVRAQEACTTVAANTDTRYSGIYQAVIDSPETAPAELSYYRDLGITNA